MYQDALLNSLTNQNWKPEDLEFEKEQAFNDGYKQGFDAGQIAMQEYFKKNIKKATKITEDIIKYFKTIPFDCATVLLKIHGLDSFEVLFIVDNEQFISDSKKLAYRELRIVKEKHNSSKFNIDFLMMPNGSSFNEALIKADGFTLKYEPKSR